MGPAEIQPSTSTTSRKRRIRRKNLEAFRSATSTLANQENNTKHSDLPDNYNWDPNKEIKGKSEVSLAKVPNSKTNNLDFKLEMSSNDEKKSREDVKAAREAKKLAKLKAKNKEGVHIKITKESTSNAQASSEDKKNSSADNVTVATKNTINVDPPVVITSKETPKSKDEVDRASIKDNEVKLEGDKSRDQINVERAAKKAAKQSKKKKEGGGDVPAAAEMTVQDVVETLKDIVSVAKEMQDVTAKVQAISLDPQKKQADESAKSKAELKAERRAKQEAERAAKQATTQKVAPSPKEEPKTKPLISEPIKEVKVPKAKSVEKTKPKSQSENRVNWFQHLDMLHDKESLLNIPINSNIHPAIIKLGVQLATRVVSGSNARCIALLDALKQMVRDYSLPAKTEFARGLEATLAAGLRYLWRLRQPAASQENAVKFFRHHLAQLPNNVDEFDAKKTLQEEIDRYIREQIDMAGEAISLAVRAKISSGDLILTYGCSSLIERILREAWAAGVQFRVVVVGSRVNGGGREMLRRLTAAGVPTQYADVAALSFVMASVSKVLIGASALLVNGSVLAAAGTAQAALVARAHNTPVLVACETHKFSERVQTDAFVFNEIGDPDELIDKSDSNSPLKDWRSNPNLTPLNLTYDVTPPSLVTAVVTELAILPCTSAPVVLRFKLSEYGV